MYKNPHRKESAIAAQDLRKQRNSSYLTSWILSCANRGLPVGEFLPQVSERLMDLTRCDETEIRVINRDKLVQCVGVHHPTEATRVESTRAYRDDAGIPLPRLEAKSDLEVICEEIARGRFDASLPFFTSHGSFVFADTEEPLELSSETCKWAGGRTLHITSDFRSMAVIPFLVEEKDRCLLLLKKTEPEFFTTEQIRLYEEIARIIGIALGQMHAQVALRERIKELTCLYGIARVAAEPGIELEQLFESAVRLLPPGWLYPDHAAARITFDQQSRETPNFSQGVQVQSSAIIIGGENHGLVEVAYTEPMPELDEGPFLKEERNLIDAIAKELALIIERKQAEKDKEELRTQLLHADRLATIGQLAAGVAHELNEPLGGILGFAQLLEKDHELGEQSLQDVGKIVSASLHAREVISKLMLFARETPAQRQQVNLNHIVEKGLYFLESRCANADVRLQTKLAPDLPDFSADAGQLLQVLVNLVVNAIQAMPKGGDLTIRTEWHDPCVQVTVEDTGMGMSKEVLDKIFVPFFTTKDVNEGTGLGLAVVQGIVTAHGGTISVESTEGKGTRFDVLLPIDGNEHRTAKG